MLSICWLKLKVQLSRRLLCALRGRHLGPPRFSGGPAGPPGVIEGPAGASLGGPKPPMGSLTDRWGIQRSLEKASVFQRHEKRRCFLSKMSVTRPRLARLVFLK